VNPGRIVQRAELDPLEGETPGKPAMQRRRRYILKTVTYRYPVEDGIARMLRSLRDRIGANDLREYLGPAYPFSD
jgi:hypothetical protein